MFSEVNQLVRLLLTVPVSSASAERSFSALRRLKSYTRSTMSAARLNHVAILHIHKDIAADVPAADVGNLFVSEMKSRIEKFGEF
jgi:hAT family C-terminal dimerisation region